MNWLNLIYKYFKVYNYLIREIISYVRGKNTKTINFINSYHPSTQTRTGLRWLLVEFSKFSIVKLFK